MRGAQRGGCRDGKAQPKPGEAPEFAKALENHQTCPGRAAHMARLGHDVAETLVHDGQSTVWGGGSPEAAVGVVGVDKDMHRGRGVAV